MPTSIAPFGEILKTSPQFLLPILPLLFCVVTGLFFGYSADLIANRLLYRRRPVNRAFWIRRVALAVLFALFAVGYCAALSSGFARFPNYPSEAWPCRYVVHLLAAWIMLTATLTDFDDYIIPDALMIPATCAALILMTVLPASLPCVTHIVEPAYTGTHYGPLNACATESWSAGRQIAVGLGCWLFWCFALFDRRWYPRLGVRRAAILFGRRLRQSPLTPILAVAAVLGAVLIVCVVRSESWPQLNAWYEKRGLIAGDPVESPAVRLLSSLIGMTVGMATIWLVRIAGRVTLGREAMGFGDVVLMGFIGSIVGWQGAILVFFLAPFAGLVFGLARALFRSEREIPYGPFLCLATAALFFFWPKLWAFVEPVFSDPGAILTLGAIAAVLLFVLLALIRLAKTFIFGR